MKKFISKLLLPSLLSLPVCSFAQEGDVDFTAEVIGKMTNFYMNGIDEKLYLQFDKPYYSSGDQIWFKGYLRNAITHAPLEHSNFIYVELLSQSSELVSRVKVKRDSTGFNGYMTLDPEMAQGNYTIRAYTRWMLNKSDEYMFSKSLKIISPIPPSAYSIKGDSTRRERKQAELKLAEKQKQMALRDEYSVQFFPEGGALLAGTSQIMAFKAVAQDGYSTEVEGDIFNSKDEHVAQFKSTHKGMGMVALIADQGESYYATTISEGGIERRFDLPTVEAEGVNITARNSGKKLLFRVNSTSGELLDGAHVIIHSHGRVVSVVGINESNTHVISTTELFDGVNIISLVDDQGEIMAERLVFKRPEQSPTLTISTDRDNYMSRDKACVTMNILDSFGQIASGEFGVSVTDDNSVKFDQEDGNILSYLLLSSDLQGHIEAPGLYFEGDLTQADRNLDLLMRTQGWRRFDLSKILAGDNKAPTIQYEKDAEIVGNVKGFFGNNARRPKLDILCSSQNYFDTFELDESSHFKLVGLNIPDSTTYIIQSRGKRGGNSLTLNIEPELFATPRAALAPRAEQEYVPSAFINQSQDKFFYEGGMNLINIDAVYVTATKEEADTKGAFSTYSTTNQELEAMSGLPLTSVLQRYPSITISTEGVSYRGNSSLAKFLVDGMYMEYEEITYLTANDVERVDFYSGADAAMYSDAAGGIFVIEMRTGYSSTASAVTAPGIAFVSQLGYQKPDELYQPHYHVAKLKSDLPPDYRTTLFWDGHLSPDHDGNINFEFYTSDQATTYTITIEGVTPEGEICRTTKTINRTASR